MHDVRYPYLSSCLLTFARKLLHPSTARLSPSEFYNSITKLETWEKGYRDTEPLLYRVVRDFRRSYYVSDMTKENLQPVLDYLEEATPLFYKAVEEYRFNYFSLSTFLTRSRLQLILNPVSIGMTAFLLDCFALPKEPRITVTKDQIKLLWDTFVLACKAIQSSIDEHPKETQLLERLGLPTDTAQLKELLATTTEHGELFPWGKTSQGFGYWATSFLEESTEEFQSKINRMINTLDPAVHLPTQTKAKAGLNLNAALKAPWEPQPVAW